MQKSLESEGNGIKGNTPKWVWLLLTAAVFGVSSAGALFQQVDDVPPLASIVALAVNSNHTSAPLAFVQWNIHQEQIRGKMFQSNTIKWLVASGFFSCIALRGLGCQS